MSVKYGKFEMPSKILENETKGKKNFSQFVVEPFERGFGHTLGNSMRRIMLTSLEAPAIVSVRMEGVPHEYMAIEGITEDMTNIILNFKNALLRRLPGEEEYVREPRALTKVIEISQDDLDENGGSVDVTLGDIVQEGLFEIVNPKLHIFTATSPLKKQIDLKVAFGRGYVPSERIEMKETTTDEIVIDASFSPVILVNYWIENTRVGQDTDYDRLMMEVLTDGRITPAEAVTFASSIAQMHFDVFSEIKSIPLVFDDKDEEEMSDEDELIDKLALRIDEIELSVRSTNCLSGANIDTIAELVMIPERKMLEFKNFGKKSLHEIKNKLVDMGLHLGMDLSKYGIFPENVKEKMRLIHEEKKAKNEVFSPSATKGSN